MNHHRVDLGAASAARSAGLDWRDLVKRPETLTRIECQAVLAELEGAIRSIDTSLLRHGNRDSTDPNWVMRARAARMHRARDARLVMDRLLVLLLESVPDMPAEDRQLARFVAAATALLSTDQLTEIWMHVRADADHRSGA